MTEAHVFLATKTKNEIKSTKQSRLFHYREMFSIQKSQAMVVTVCHPDGPRARHHNVRGTIELSQLIAFAAPRTSLH